MKTLRDLYRIGHGPSSSHTMAPSRAALAFGADHPEAATFRVVLYGSLAASGKGHLTDKVIAATRALSCARFALLSDGLHRISFDDVVAVLLETGRALPALYRETATGGLARIYEKRIAVCNDEDSPPSDRSDSKGGPSL